MKKLLLVCLMLLAGSAWADWGKYASADGADFFFDPNTVRKDERFSKVWTITNLPRRNADGVSSYRMRKEFDCPNERFRILFISLHSQKLAKGKILESSDEPDETWSEIPPHSSVRILHSLVCTK